MNDYFEVVKDYLLELRLSVTQENKSRGILVVNDESQGFVNLIICVAAPMVIFEQYIFQIGPNSHNAHQALLQKNRDIIHGAFALDESGNKVIFRNTLQVENIDLNEFASTLNSLSLLLSEFSEQIIQLSK